MNAHTKLLTIALQTSYILGERIDLNRMIRAPYTNNRKMSKQNGYGVQKRSTTSVVARSSIFCLDAILFELGVNGSYKLLFHKYLFYYLPSDLWHLTSVQTLPLYLLAGFITVEVLEHEKSHPRTAFVGSIALAICLVGGGILANR